jgi:predicted transcriptional regulator
MGMTVREEAEKLVRELPDDATWDDLMYRIYVRQKIEAGLRDAEAGRVVSQEEVERLFLGR